jgi:hypothetical protein
MLARAMNRILAGQWLWRAVEVAAHRGGLAANLVHGHPDGGYTSLFELVCCDRGDRPGLDGREVPSATASIPSLGHVSCETTLTRGARAEQRNE